MTLAIYCDGGSRGNPGPAAIGSIIRQGDKVIGTISKAIGKATNNEAEYQAVLKSLSWIKENQLFYKARDRQLVFFVDSKLVANQLAGNFKIKQPHLKDLALKTHQLISQLKATAEFNYIPRNQNYQADALVNQALDQLV